MPTKLGKCTNIGNCAKADNKDIQSSVDFLCVECGSELFEVKQDSKSFSLLVLVLGFSIILLIGAVGWFFFRTSGEIQSVENQDKVENIIEVQPPVQPVPRLTPLPSSPSTEPPVEKIPTVAVPVGPSLETQQHVKQAIVFVSLAKANPNTRSENLKNALAEFDVAVKQEEAQGRCFAIAYMNRGIAYWLDKKLNLAEKDLIKASECDDKNPLIFYNLTSYYSAINKADLALGPLNKALDLGFKDCDILRTDSDLKSLRNMNEFRRALEQHSLFCLK
jgi:hypothetical protein